MEPSQAAEHALRRILKYYPQFQGALVAANKTGAFGMFFYSLLFIKDHSLWNFKRQTA